MRKIPKQGPFIAAANHISLGDPPCVGAIFWRTHISFYAKKELFEGKRWGWWFKAIDCIRLNREGDPIALQEGVRRLKQGRKVGIFPEGTRSFSGNFLPAQLGIDFLQDKTNVPVVPFYVKGTDKALAKGGSYHPFQPVRAYIGEVVDLSKAKEIENKKERYRYIADSVMQAIADIKKQVEDGTYKP